MIDFTVYFELKTAEGDWVQCVERVEADSALTAAFVAGGGWVEREISNYRNVRVVETPKEVLSGILN